MKGLWLAKMIHTKKLCFRCLNKVNDRLSGLTLPHLYLNKDRPNSPLTQAAHFYLAKAYLQTGNLAKAETEMNVAAEITGSMKEEAAADLARLHAVLAAK
jgi:hypothetical protein